MTGAWAGALLSLIVATPASAVLIDGFDSGSLVFVGPSSTVETESVGASLGGERDDSVTNASTSGGILAGASGSVYSYGGVNANGTAVLTWDGSDGSPALDPNGLLGADLTNGGASDGFAIDILSNDFVASLILTVYSGPIDLSQYTLSTPGGIPSGPTETLFVYFADFIPTGAGADFANVGAITLEIDALTEPQLDLTLDEFRSTNSISVVPEPTPMLLLVSGLAGMSWHRRRMLRSKRRSGELPGRRRASRVATTARPRPSTDTSAASPRC